MRYSRDEFFRLMDAIQAEGGVHLDKVHEHSNYTRFSGGPTTSLSQSYIKNCGESTLFEVPYEPYGHAGTLTTVEVCAIDDWMGRWPRFAGANAKGEE